MRNWTDRAQKARGSEWTGGKYALAVSLEDVARGNGGGRRCKRGGKQAQHVWLQYQADGAARHHSTVAAGGWGARRAEQISASCAPEGSLHSPVAQLSRQRTSRRPDDRADKLTTPNSNPTSERAVDDLECGIAAAQHSPLAASHQIDRGWRHGEATSVVAKRLDLTSRVSRPPRQWCRGGPPQSHITKEKPQAKNKQKTPQAPRTLVFHIRHDKPDTPPATCASLAYLQMHFAPGRRKPWKAIPSLPPT